MPRRPLSPASALPYRPARRGPGPRTLSAPVHRPASAPRPRIARLKRGGGMPAVCPAALFSFAPVFPAPDFLGDCSGSVCCFRAYPGRRFFRIKKPKAEDFFGFFVLQIVQNRPIAFDERGEGDSAVGRACRGKANAVPTRIGPAVFSVEVCGPAPVCKDLANIRVCKNPVQIVWHGLSDARIARAVDFALVQYIPQCDFVRKRKIAARLRAFGNTFAEQGGERRPEPVLRMPVVKPRLSGFGRRHCAQNEDFRPFVINRRKGMSNQFQTRVLLHISYGIKHRRVQPWNLWRPAFHCNTAGERTQCLAPVRVSGRNGMTSCAGRWLHQNGRAQIFAWVSFVNAQQPMDSPPDGRKTADSGRFAVHSYPSSPQVGAAHAFPHALFFSDPGAIFFSIPLYRSRAAANVECSAAVLTRRARFASPITFQMRRFADFRTCSALCAFRTAAAFVCARNVFVLLRRRCAFDCADLAVSLRTPRLRRCVPRRTHARLRMPPVFTARRFYAGPTAHTIRRADVSFRPVPVYGRGLVAQCLPPPCIPPRLCRLQAF